MGISARKRMATKRHKNHKKKFNCGPPTWECRMEHEFKGSKNAKGKMKNLEAEQVAIMKSGRAGNWKYARGCVELVSGGSDLAGRASMLHYQEPTPRRRGQGAWLRSFNILIAASASFSPPPGAMREFMTS